MREPDWEMLDKAYKAMKMYEVMMHRYEAETLYSYAVECLKAGVEPLINNGK